MPDLLKPETGPGPTTILAGIAADGQKRIEQQTTLLRTEMQRGRCGA
jgi:hypothetical protein